MRHLTLIALVVAAGFLAVSFVPAAADGVDQSLATARPMPSTVAAVDTQPEAESGAQQMSPARAGNRGVEAADVAIGSLLSLSSLALVAVFGSRWLVGRRR